MQRVEGDGGDVGAHADAVGGVEHDGLDLERAATADGGRRDAAGALRGEAGVDDPAGTARRVVEAEADGNVARDGFGTHARDMDLAVRIFNVGEEHIP